MKIIKITMLVAIMAGVLSGCETPTYLAQPDDAKYAPPEEVVQKAVMKDGGLYQANYNWSLVEDRSTYHVGDLLTIVLDESTQASKQAKTSFKKDSDVTIGVPKIFGRSSTSYLSAQVDGNRDFDGGASSQQQNMLRGQITVAVHKVLPNGILEINGEKWLTLNQGDEYIRVTGLVRSQDIGPDNSISSQRIANARITYSGRGTLSDSNTAGLLTRLFNHPFFPI